MGDKAKKKLEINKGSLIIIAVALLVPLAVITLIVGAALFYIGALNPRNVTPTTCTFPPGLTCSFFKLNAETGALDFRMGQATAHTINVTGVACTKQEGSPSCIMDGVPNTCPRFAGSVTIPRGEQMWVSGGESPNAIRCTDENGNQVNFYDAQPGDFYKGKIWVRYVEIGTGEERTVVGDLMAKYEN